MLKSVYILLSQTFGITLWVAIPIIIIFLLALIIIVGMCLVLLLDILYRPNSPKSPYNLILDHIIPIITIISPSILIGMLSENVASWIEKFVYIILVHLCVLIPLMYFWSRNRNWAFTHEEVFHSWSNPRLYLDISVAFIYPALIGVYFTIVRYSRFGITLDIYCIIEENFNYIIIALFVVIILFRFFWKYLVNLFLFIYRCTSYLRNFIWNRFIIIIKSIVLFLLKYRLFFKFCEILFKVSFFWLSYIIHHPLIYQTDRTFFRKMLHYIYLKPIFIYMIPFILAPFELFFMDGHLFYSLNLFLLIIFCKPFIYFLNNFNTPETNWVLFCCYSNYFHLKWFNSYYEKTFWLSFDEIRESINQKIILTQDQENRIRDTICYWETKEYHSQKRAIYFSEKFAKSDKLPYCLRYRIAYKNWSLIF